MGCIPEDEIILLNNATLAAALAVWESPEGRDVLGRLPVRWGGVRSLTVEWAGGPAGSGTFRVCHYRMACQSYIDARGGAWPVRDSDGGTLDAALLAECRRLLDAARAPNENSPTWTWMPHSIVENSFTLHRNGEATGRFVILYPDGWRARGTCERPEWAKDADAETALRLAEMNAMPPMPTCPPGKHLTGINLCPRAGDQIVSLAFEGADPRNFSRAVRDWDAGMRGPYGPRRWGWAEDESAHPAPKWTAGDTFVHTDDATLTVVVTYSPTWHDGGYPYVCQDDRGKPWCLRLEETPLWLPCPDSRTEG